MQTISRSILFLLTVYLLNGALFAQDSLPEILPSGFDWKTLEQPAFNQKDAVRLIIAKEGLGQMFSDEPNDSYINNFHFFDLNGDKFSDVVYSGIPFHTKINTTLIFTGSADRNFPKKFSATGSVCRIISKGNWVDLVIRSEGNEKNPLTYIRKYSVDLDSGKSILNAEVCFLFQTEIPEKFEPTSEELAKSCSMHSSPEKTGDKPVDFDGDGIIDGNGNVFAYFRAGSQLVKLYARTINDLTWDFVMVARAHPQETALFSRIKPGFTFIAGWVQDEFLK